MNDYAFGNFLYTLRTEKGLSQTQLAQLLGVTNKAVSKWETGASKPNTSLIPKVAEILGVSVEELFAGKRFEKDTELDRIKIHLAKQKKTYAVLSSVFLALTVILPMLMIEFVCVMMVFQLPDEVAGPLGAMVLIFAFVAALVAFLIYRSNYRHIWTSSDMMLKPAFIRGLQFAVLFCVIGLPNLVVAAAIIYYLLAATFRQTMAADIFLYVAALILILLFGTTVCLLRIKRLLKIRVIRIKLNSNPIPFRERPLWLRGCTVAAFGLLPVSICLQFSMQSRLKYGVMLIWLASNLVLIIKGIRKED